MSAGKLDITVEEGATWRTGLDYLQPDGVTPYDLTDATLKMQVRLRPGTSEPSLLSVSSAASGSNGAIIVTDPTSGHFSVLLTAAGTSKLQLKCAYYDLIITYLLGDTNRLLEGRVLIDRRVTE